MVRQIDPTEIHEEIFPGDADGTVWRFRVPTTTQDKEITRAAQASSAGGGFVVDGGNMELTALHLCMESPRGFLTSEGEEVQWETMGFGSRKQGAPTVKYLNGVPPSVRTWLANLIQSASSVTQEEAKNS